MDVVVLMNSANRFGRAAVKTAGVGLVVLASIWATSWALEPKPVSTEAAPEPQSHPEAVIQVYGANVWGWRGRFAIHTWLAIKPENAKTYTIYQVMGWRLRRSGSALSVADGDPDRPWFGSPAILLHDVRGAEAAELMTKVETAALAYPFSKEYTMWPGPNSNSFTAWVGLEVPELDLKLPAKALGKSWMQTNYASIKGSD